LIQTIACGVAVLGASHAYGQADDTSGTTFGTLQPADENGDSIEGTAGEATSQATESGQTLTQSPAQSIGDPSGLPTYSQPLYPPGVEIPLTETEIPGSAYFVGPDGERIDASTLLNQVPPIQEQIIPSQGAPQEFSSGATFSPEGVYDGTLSFPMGTFPTTPFGERILSEVPSSGSSIGEIPGALVGGEGSGSKTMPESPGTENGVPLDQIVRPGDMPTAKEMTKPSGEKSAAGAVAEATEDPGEAPGELEAPQAAKDTRRVVNNGAEPAGSKTKKRDGRESVGAEQLTKRQARVKQALKEALAEKARLGGLLKKANLKTEGLMKEINQLKSSESKMKEETQKELASLKKSLMKSRADSQKLANSLNAKLKAVQGEKTKLARNKWKPNWPTQKRA